MYPPSLLSTPPLLCVAPLSGGSPRETNQDSCWDATYEQNTHTPHTHQKKERKVDILSLDDVLVYYRALVRAGCGGGVCA